MKHRSYEEWIMAGEPLLDEQQIQLNQHLEHCDSCQGLAKRWRQAETLIERAPVVGPAAGFALRWEARLAEDRRRKGVWQSLAFLGLAGAGAALSLFLFLGTWVGQVRPAPVISNWVEKLTGSERMFSAAAEVLPRVTVHGVESMSLAWIPVFFALLGISAIVWLKLVRILARFHGEQSCA